MVHAKYSKTPRPHADRSARATTGSIRQASQGTQVRPQQQHPVLVQMLHPDMHRTRLTKPMALIVKIVSSDLMKVSGHCLLKKVGGNLPSHLWLFQPSHHNPAELLDLRGPKRWRLAREDDRDDLHC
jgi:hypothetical protein